MPVRPGRRRRADSLYLQRATQLAMRLRQLRESAGMSQERLAARAGIGVATVRKIETGAVIEPGYFTVIAILAALGKPHGELELIDESPEINDREGA